MDAEFSEDESINSEITYQQQESGQPKRNFSDAIQYVNSVKTTFRDNPETYKLFLSLLKDYRTNRTTIRVVVSRIKLLFSEHQELIEGFNYFLPEGSRITLSLTRRPDTNFQKSIDFVNKVKVAFSQEEERYASFLQLISGHQEAGMSLQELSEQMCELLSDRQDLLEEFFDYLPSHREAFQEAALKRATMDGSIRRIKMKPAVLLGVALSVLVALGVGSAVKGGI